MFNVDMSTQECAGHVVVELRGELDQADAAVVATALAAVAAREPQMIVDLSALEFIDSLGVAALAHGRKQARRAGGDLLLAAPRLPVLRVLTLLRLMDAFSVYHCAEEAAGARRSPVAAGRASRRQASGLRLVSSATQAATQAPESEHVPSQQQAEQAKA
jgi:anti-sigma B factor antagonist